MWRGIAPGMTVVAFAAPYLLDATTRFAEAAARLPGVELALITCEPADRVPEPLRAGLAAHWRACAPPGTGGIAPAVPGLRGPLGPVPRLIRGVEHLQGPPPQVRERVGVPRPGRAAARHIL